MGFLACAANWLLFVVTAACSFFILCSKISCLYYCYINVFFGRHGWQGQGDDRLSFVSVATMVRKRAVFAVSAVFLVLN